MLATLLFQPLHPEPCPLTRPSPSHPFLHPSGPPPAQVREKEDTFKQTRLDALFAKSRAAHPGVADLEDFAAAPRPAGE